MKVAMKGLMHDNHDVVRGKQLIADLERQGIDYETLQDPVTMAFHILVGDNIPLTSDVYP